MAVYRVNEKWRNHLGRSWYEIRSQTKILTIANKWKRHYKRRIDQSWDTGGEKKKCGKRELKSYQNVAFLMLSGKSVLG